MIVYFTSYKNSDILLADDVLKQRVNSWETNSTGPMFAALSTLANQKTSHVTVPYVIPLFETKKEIKIDVEQRRVITDYIGATTDNYHLVSAYFKAGISILET